LIGCFILHNFDMGEVQMVRPDLADCDVIGIVMNGCFRGFGSRKRFEAEWPRSNLRKAAGVAAAAALFCRQEHGLLRGRASALVVALRTA
jgi:hypothetical protein